MSFLLLDSYLLLWAALDDPKLSAEARELIEDPTNALAFSAASIWELAIKHRVRPEEGRVEPRRLRQQLRQAGYQELPITSEHGLAVMRLPLLHRDPFDRMLLAQAAAEGAILLTADARLARYRGPVRLVA
ncbi:type II toxin-antitoxin system VapC family toxin [Siccirubricoccus phaeus]|uniref:type II toxin-antitoxin system VapC family toxin n=1 Tax=Siccirubricoccus phaeus TaxID=2595053 RepID=UPI0011F18D6E|nr:type II toxin-antitoxin system VapC family toxin [Siccirubricoccus phaeus]